jgi:ABC-type lipoprotein release transport system permease subunit
MARRNVWRNRRRTITTVSAMSLALFILLLYAGLMEGYLADMERNVLDLEVGDVQVFAEDYRNNPSIYTRIEDPERVLGPLQGAGFPATGRLLGFGMGVAGRSSAGVSFRGIDLARDAEVSRVHEEIERGQWLDPADPRGIVIGRRLARMLGAEFGSELLVLSQGADGAMAYDLYTVRGILRGIGDATDRTGVFMLEETFRELMVVPTGVHQIIVRRPEGVELSVAAEQIRSVVGSSHDVQTWRQLLPTVSSMLDSARAAISIMFVIVYLAVGILILNAMLMAVFERVREFGVLKAVGVSPFDVVRMIFIESAIQAGLAIGVALLLGIPALIYLAQVGVNIQSLAGVAVMGVAMQPIWRAVMTPSVFAGPIVSLIVIVVLAVIYPALKAAWIQPVAAMRYR